MPRKVPQIDVIIQTLLYVNEYESEKYYYFYQCSDYKTGAEILVHFYAHPGKTFQREERIQFTGSWNPDGTFKSKKYKRIEQSRFEKLLYFLSNAGIDGLTELRIASLLDRYGEEALEKLDDKDALSTIPGIGSRIANSIVASWKDINPFFEQVKTVDMRLENIWLASYSQKQKMLPETLLADTFVCEPYHEHFLPQHYYLAYKKYGLQMAETLLEDPYKMATEVHACGFNEADQVAGELDLLPDIKYKRMRAGILFELQQHCQSGDCYIDFPTFKTRVLDTLCPQFRIDLLERNILIRDASFFDRRNLQELDLVFKMLSELHEITLVLSKDQSAVSYATLGVISQAEDEVAASLYRMNALQRDPPDTIDLMKVTHHTGTTYDAEQQEAIRKACTSPIVLITGGAGTGKTRTIQGIITALEADGKRVLLASPTAKAARNMRDKTGHEASTIHHMLLYDGLEYGVNEENRLQGDALIIDEASMLDLKLMQAILRAMPEGMSLILVGDVNQLEPVGCGAPFRDMMHSGCFPTVRLQTTYRQQEGSGIITLSKSILRGEVPAFEGLPDCTFIPVEDAVQIREEIKKQIDRLLKEGSLPDTENPIKKIMVLSPVKGHMLGTDNLNQVIKNAFNPASSSEQFHEFACGDLVIQNVNNHTLKVFNGSIGTVTNINDDGSISVVFDDDVKDGRIVQYGPKEQLQLSHAYAITIHKSQGSEYPVVIIPMAIDYMGENHHRNLLYTAVTRAQKKLILIGSMEALEGFAKTVHSRVTFLKEKIITAFSAAEGAEQ